MKYILSISLIMSLFGCGNSGQIEQELSTAAKLMRSEPDSSLRIIENIDPDRILGRHARAKYALLYSAALDKNYVDTDDDSLIRIAYRYYDKRICSDSVKFLINYHYGRIHQNGANYQEAMHYYLTAEKYALAAHKNYYLGLVYTRIGELYSEQMNFNGALEYYRNAYDAWKKLRNPAFMNNATLNIANTYSSLNDNDNAVKYYLQALQAARQQGDNDMVIACLSNLGDIYVSKGDYPKALQAVKEIERIVPDGLSIYQYRILIKVYSDAGARFAAASRGGDLRGGLRNHGTELPLETQFAGGFRCHADLHRVVDSPDATAACGADARRGERTGGIRAGAGAVASAAAGSDCPMARTVCHHVAGRGACLAAALLEPQPARLDRRGDCIGGSQRGAGRRRAHASCVVQLRKGPHRTAGSCQTQRIPLYGVRRAARHGPFDLGGSRATTDPERHEHRLYR